MKVILELDTKNSKPVEGMVIQYLNGSWVACHKDKVFEAQLDTIKAQNDKISTLNERVNKLTDYVHKLAEAVRKG